MFQLFDLLGAGYTEGSPRALQDVCTAMRHTVDCFSVPRVGCVGKARVASWLE